MDFVTVWPFLLECDPYRFHQTRKGNSRSEIPFRVHRTLKSIVSLLGKLLGTISGFQNLLKKLDARRVSKLAETYVYSDY